MGHLRRSLLFCPLGLHQEPIVAGQMCQEEEVGCLCCLGWCPASRQDRASV